MTDQFIVLLTENMFNKKPVVALTKLLAEQDILHLVNDQIQMDKTN